MKGWQSDAACGEDHFRSLWQFGERVPQRAKKLDYLTRPHRRHLRCSAAEDLEDDADFSGGDSGVVDRKWPRPEWEIIEAGSELDELAGLRLTRYVLSLESYFENR